MADYATPDAPLDSPTTPPQIDKAHFIKLGVLAGMIYLTVLVVLYLVDRKLLLNPGLDLLIANVFYWVVIIKAISDYKRQNNFTLSIGEGLKAGLLAGIFVALAYHLFMFVLFNYVDPSMIEVQVEVMMELVDSVASFVGNEGMDDNMQEELERAIDETGATGYPIGAVVTGLASSLFWILIISLIVSAIKKTR